MVHYISRPNKIKQLHERLNCIDIKSNVNILPLPFLLTTVIVPLSVSTISLHFRNSVMLRIDFCYWYLMRKSNKIKPFHYLISPLLIEFGLMIPFMNPSEKRKKPHQPANSAKIIAFTPNKVKIVI